VDPKSATRIVVTSAALACVLVLAAGFAWVRASQPALPPELAGYMGDLQHHTHKLTLSIAAENAELAEFYLHEVGETAEQIEALFPQHDGVPVADLARKLLEPRLVTLDAALEGARWDDAQRELGELVAACNDCHAAAGHAFIRVEVSTANPFNQSFAPTH
jgi:hypothetical protein